MVVFNKPLRRSQVLPFSAKLAPCLIGMEACASAHYWARELKNFGHDARLMPARDVRAYLKRGKNDAVDAAACCEAVQQTTVRTVPVKTPEQQAQLMQHRVRDLLKCQRTQVARSHSATTSTSPVPSWSMAFSSSGRFFMLPPLTFSR